MFLAKCIYGLMSAKNWLKFLKLFRENIRSIFPDTMYIKKKNKQVSSYNIMTKSSVSFTSNALHKFTFYLLT